MKKTNNIMKAVSGLGLVLLGTFANGHGLENVIVEKYYISNSADAAATGGVLPVGSVTYRIYVDMLPGYKFEAAYGVPGHELRLATSTLFYNNEDRSTNAPAYNATLPAYNRNQAGNKTLMLDSWLSVGAASKGYFGIPKEDDNGIETIVNTDGVLQNADPASGIPIKVQDGMVAGYPEEVTPVGISNEMEVFNNLTKGRVFSTSNGAWASLNGSVGPTPENKVLIAQVTTDGVFSFELNIQIGTPTGEVEQYVAKSPVGQEVLLPCLTYTSPRFKTSEIHSVISNSSLMVYPNPTNGMVSLEINSTNLVNSNNYTIYDEQGNVICDKSIGMIKGNYTENIDLTSFAKGQYLIELLQDGIKSTQQLVKY